MSGNDDDYCSEEADAVVPSPTAHPKERNSKKEKHSRRSAMPTHAHQYVLFHSQGKHATILSNFARQVILMGEPCSTSMATVPTASDMGRCSQRPDASEASDRGDDKGDDDKKREESTVVNDDLKAFATGEAYFHYAKCVVAAKDKSNDGNATRREALLAHAAKFADPELKPNIAKSYGSGGRNGFALTEAELKAWDKAKDAVQYQICRARLAQSGGDEVHRTLLATGAAQLVHFDGRAGDDCYWGGKLVDVKEDSQKVKTRQSGHKKTDRSAGGKNDDDDETVAAVRRGPPPPTPQRLVGKNRLGQIWMAFREQLRRSGDEAAAIAAHEGEDEAQ